MSRPTIALVMPVCNDLRWLRTTLPYEMRWADQVCILDMGSTDGTREYCRMFLRENDRYMRRETNTCPELGFDEANNAAASMALTDWIYFGAADECIRPTQWDVVQKELAAAEGFDSLKVDRHNLSSSQGFNPAAWEHQFDIGNHEVETENLVRIIRRGVGIMMRGYIHEEPFKGETSCHFTARYSNLGTLHFQSGCDPHLRRMRYSWMFQRAIDNPELQKYTNRWWYDVYCKRPEVDIKGWAEKYEKHMAETGQK